MRRSRQIDGRHLGWSASDLATKPYAKFWNPNIAPIREHVREALFQGAVADILLPPVGAAQDIFFGKSSSVENGFSISDAGALRVAVQTDMPNVQPEMIDWWFGWHSDSPERYKLWHPNAHVHAMWHRQPPAKSRGRARYVGFTSIVDEYLGCDFIRGAISFVEPRDVGLTDSGLDAGGDATAICARTTLAGAPITAGVLVHYVKRTPTGSTMRSRFWIGGNNINGRGVSGMTAAALARRILKPTDADARALLVHCAQEMAHLATFLPALYREFKDTD